jgi:hypothetical protein
VEWLKWESACLASRDPTPVPPKTNKQNKKKKKEENSVARVLF